MNKQRFILPLLIGLSILFNQPFAGSDLATAGSTASIYLPAILHRYDPIVDAQIFGVQMYGDTGASSPYHPYLIGSGASWLRVNLSWKLTEPSNTFPKSYDWTIADRNLQAARADMGGLNLIVTVEDNPEWASDIPQGPIQPAYVDDFALFLTALVERYDGDGVDDAPDSPVVRYWELYNEPDRTGDGGRWGNDGDRYAAMLQTVYPAIKSANPDALVVMGGLAFDWFEEDGGPFNRSFLPDVLAAGGGNYLDVMNFHVYPFFSQNWTGVANQVGVIAKTAAVRDIMNTYGWEGPIVITEAGTHDNNPVGAPSSPERQARFVVTLFIESMAADLDAMIWWMLYDVGGFYPFNNGLVTNSDNPIKTKLSYTVYQNLVKEMGSAHFVRTLTAGELKNSQVSAHHFTDFVNNRDIYVVWRSVVTEEAYTVVKLPASSAVVRDSITFGTIAINDLDDGVADKMITLPVNGRPLYVEVNR